MPWVGPFILLGGFILRAQYPQMVGYEVLNFQVVGRGGFQLVDQHIQGFFVLPAAAETTVLAGWAGFRASKVSMVKDRGENSELGTEG